MTKISIQNEIGLYMHCRRCLEEIPDGVSPRDWQQTETGWTDLGFQVWCKRHECNVIHMDFEGHEHPATDAWMAATEG